MTDLFDLPPPPPATPPTAPALPDSGDDSLNLANYAQRAYLEYALSVVKGRALPDVCDGQKPVQRRILYSMSRMGLGFGGANGSNGAKPVKSARVVGDVLGRFHPHGDQAAYDALVRMAQDFSQRYPLIDGQGNFGSRDGTHSKANSSISFIYVRESHTILIQYSCDTITRHTRYPVVRLLPSVVAEYATGVTGSLHLTAPVDFLTHLNT